MQTLSLSPRFRELRPFAEGGMGSLYTGVDRVSGRPVVVKVVREDLLSDPETVARFEHEIDVVRSLRHASVPTWVDDGVARGRRYLAMAHVDGMSVAELCVRTGRRLPLSTSLFIAMDAVRALDALHGLVTADGAPRNVVHRDISPHNLVVDGKGRTHLIDFGIAVEDAWSDPSEPGTITAKLAYAAPEHAAGFPVDARADQFSTGIVLWELLTGRRLFARDSLEATRCALLACDVPRVDALVPGVPRSVADVVARMLDCNRTRRFATCGAAAEALSLAAANIDFADTPPFAVLRDEARRARRPVAPPAAVATRNGATRKGATRKGATRKVDESACVTA